MIVIPGPSGIATGIGLSSITYPLALPPLPSFAKISITMEDVIGENESPFDYSAQTYDWNADRLSLSAALPPMPASLARAWVAWLAALRGKVGTFLAYDTSQPNPRGSGAGVPIVSGNGQAGRQLVIRGLQPNAVDVLRSADWIQLGVGAAAHAHMVLTDSSADGGGNCTLNIYPQLRVSPNDGDPINLNKACGVFRLTSNQRKFDVDSALLYGISFDAKEDL
jgi:hypothetical protein